MQRAFIPLLAVAGFVFMTAPILIARARFESTMGLVQKIFYFHMPPAMLMLLSAIFCGAISAVYLIKRSGRLRDGDLAVRLPLGQYLADDTSADDGGADIACRFCPCALVRVRGLPVVVHRAHDTARANRRTACDARSTLSRERGMKVLIVVMMLLASAMAFAQDPQSEFKPVTEVPASEQLPSAPLVIAAYAFVWLAFMAYAWTMWRKLGKVERELNAVSVRIAKKP
jgi:hypothetical protein